MLVLPDIKKLDTNIIRHYFDDSKLSFVNEETMMQKIGLRPGSVSPFALINNIERDIQVIFDDELRDKLVWFHPLQNDNTIVIEMSHVEKFLDNLCFPFHFFKL